MLIYPTIQTIQYSFADKKSEVYVGFENYRYIFGNQEFRQSIINNLLWMVVFFTMQRFFVRGLTSGAVKG